MARSEEETQDLEDDVEEKESESLIGDDDDLFGDDAVAPELEELDKNGRYADEDEAEDEEDEDDGVDFDEM